MYEHHASYVIAHLVRRFVETDQAGDFKAKDEIFDALRVIEREFPDARAELDALYGITKEQS